MEKNTKTIKKSVQNKVNIKVITTKIFFKQHKIIFYYNQISLIIIGLFNYVSYLACGRTETRKKNLVLIIKHKIRNPSIFFKIKTNAETELDISRELKLDVIR